MVHGFLEFCRLHGKAFQKIIPQDAVYDIGLSVSCVADEEIKRKKLRDSIRKRHAVAHNGSLAAVEGLQQGECHDEVPFFGRKPVPDGSFHQRADITEIDKIPGVSVVLQLQADGGYPAA